MDSVVEKVAMAIYDAMDIADSLNLTAATTYAEASIEAMREPTEEMEASGVVSYGDRFYFARHDAELCWKAMIDAVLAESKEG